jgi:heat-inducible transcriptional repressor
MAELIDTRARRLLRSLIAQYIREGEPVGSRTLAKRSGLDISSATVRNILADLEEFGLVAAPHTSAGRVPTAQGYRMFVDSLLQLEPLPNDEMQRIRQSISVTDAPSSLLNNASELLSAMSHFVGVVSVPQRSALAVRHIDFVPLDSNRVLVILVFTDQDVQNRIIHSSRPYSASELEQAANYLNAHFAGRSFNEIHQILLHELQATRSEMERVLSAAMELSEKALMTDAEDVLVSGQTRLMGVQDLSDMSRLRELFDTFARKREMLQLLDRCAKAPGLRVFIGEETGLAPMDSCALVAAPYQSQGKVLGVIGVIGPTRMAYERVIPIVEATASAISEALNTPDLNSPGRAP